MKKTRNLLRAGSLLVLGLFGGVPVGAELESEPVAANRWLAPNPFSDWLTSRVRDSVLGRLELDQRQLRAIHELSEAHGLSLLEEIEAAKTARWALLDAVRSADPDALAIRSAHQGVAETELQLWLHGADILQELRRILRHDQLLEAEALIDELVQAAELHFDNLEENLRTGEPLGRKWRRRAYRDYSR